MSNEIVLTKFMAAVASFLITAFLAVSSVSADWGDRRQLRRELELFHSFLQKHPKGLDAAASEPAARLQPQIPRKA